MIMKCSDFILFIWILIILWANITRDSNRMDEYDRYWGIAGEGKTRGILGYIYKDGEFDFWSNVFDHNPYY